jgi:microcystin-dependent protein
MLYVPPIGGAADDPYVDANPSVGVEGSPVSAAAIEHPMREIMSVITGAGLTPDGNDLTQLRQAIQQMLLGAQKAVVISNATFEASVADGEAVRWDAANNRFDEAVADGTANNRAVGIADVTNAKVYIYGECPHFVGLTPGARYYLSDSVVGAVTTSAPTDKVVVGIAKSATVLWIDIDASPAQQGVDTGAVVYFPATVAPSGYVKANGALLSRTTYAALWAYAQASGNISATDGAWQAGMFSPGDGATTFRIPDLRGEFVRGWDNGRGVDSGRGIGTFQADEIKSHSHPIAESSGGAGNGGINSSFASDQAVNVSTQAAGGTETRPRNIAALACIKY